MAGPIETFGDIEIFCHVDEHSASRGSSFFGKITPGDSVYLVFSPDDGSVAPYRLKVTSPSGKVIVEKNVADLPTRAPQSPPPISFVISATGTYRVEIKESNGRQKGEATLRVD